MKTLYQFLEQGEPSQEPKKEDPKVKQAQAKENMLKKRVLMTKIRAVRGGAEGIMASYEPNIEGVIEYFYEEGINEQGFDQLIEEIGLEEFVNFVDESALALNEERAARRATVRAKKFDVVKKEVDKADAARKKAKKGEYAPSYAKKETDVTVYDDKPAAKKKAPVKKTVAKKAAPKPVAKKPVAKKVVKAVAKVKKTQPVKKPSKQGLGDRIRSAYKAGVKRHRKATQVPRVFAKGVKAGAKKAVKFAKDVKKVVSEEEMKEGIMQMIKRVKKKPAKKAEKAMDAGARAKRKLARKVHAKYVSGSEDLVPDNIREGDVHSGQGEKIQSRTKKWMDKKGQKGAPGLDAIRARAAEHKAKRGVKEEVVDEAKIDDVKYSKDEKRKNYETDIHTLSVNKGVRSDRNKRHSATDVAFKGHAATHRDRMQKHYKSRGVKKEEVVLEKDLNAAERRALPDKDFALPGKGKGPEGKQAGSYPIPDLTHARAALAMVAKYGTPEEKEKVRAAVKRKFPEIHQEAKRNPNRLVEPRDGVDSAKEVNRATRKAAFRPFNKEDKAFDYVVAKLKKQHGDGVLTKGDKMPEPSAAQKKKNAEMRAKRAKEDRRDPTEKASDGRYSDRYSNRGSD